jgi:hypothetical protein
VAVSKRLRYEILRRDNHACRYCGGTAPDVALTVDHVIPSALGGADDPSNLVAACRDCNAGKSASSPDAPVVEDVAADALRWAAAMAEASRLACVKFEQREIHRGYFCDVWRSHYGDLDDLPSAYGVSIDDFMAAGLGYDDFEIAVEVTAQYRRRDPWRYFCGISWNRVAALQSVARQLLETEG